MSSENMTFPGEASKTWSYGVVRIRDFEIASSNAIDKSDQRNARTKQTKLRQVWESYTWMREDLFVDPQNDEI